MQCSRFHLLFELAELQPDLALTLTEAVMGLHHWDRISCSFYRDSPCPGTDNVEIRLLQLNASRSVTIDGRTNATRPERRCSPDLRVGHTRACHGEPFLVACRLWPSSSRSPIFVVDGLLTAMVTHQVRCAPSHKPAAGLSVWNTLPKDLCAVTDPGLKRKQLKTHFFGLAVDVC